MKITAFHGSIEDIVLFDQDNEYLAASKMPRGMTAFSSNPAVAKTYCWPLGIPTRAGKAAERKVWALEDQWVTGPEIQAARKKVEEIRSNLSETGPDDSFLYKVKITTNNPKIIDAEGRFWYEVIPSKIKGERGKCVNILAREAKEEGFDSIIVKNVIDCGNFNDEYEADTIIVFSSDQVEILEQTVVPVKRK